MGAEALKAENLFSFDEYIKAVQQRSSAAMWSCGVWSAASGQDEERSGKFSAMTVKKVRLHGCSAALCWFRWCRAEVELQAGSMELGIIAPSAPQDLLCRAVAWWPGVAGCLLVAVAMAILQEPRAPLPTILAISRGEQRHVAKLFRALRAEQHNWQLLVPMRTSNTPDFFEPAGITMLEQFLQAVLDDHNRDITPFAPMSSAALLSLASKAPDRTGSLNLITGFLPQFCEIEALRGLKNIHFYVGDSDELGPGLRYSGGHAHMHIVKGASHYDINEFIDLEDPWMIEMERFIEAAMAESPELKLGAPRKRKRSALQLRPDFVHPAGPGELPWAWRLADTLSSPRRCIETSSYPAAERRKPTGSERPEAKRKLDWEPFFREGRERTLPDKLIFEKSALPWAWRLPFR
eukprot:Skav218136  [mRNA]  locus=scaffold759:409962:414180:- [translate_table: standard]